MIGKMVIRSVRPECVAPIEVWVSVSHPPMVGDTMMLRNGKLAYRVTARQWEQGGNTLVLVGDITGEKE